MVCSGQHQRVKYISSFSTRADGPSGPLKCVPSQQSLLPQPSNVQIVSLLPAVEARLMTILTADRSARRHTFLYRRPRDPHIAIRIAKYHHDSSDNASQVACTLRRSGSELRSCDGLKNHIATWHIHHTGDFTENDVQLRVVQLLPLARALECWIGRLLCGFCLVGLAKYSV